jgi:hypothetical protein
MVKIVLIVIWWWVLFIGFFWAFSGVWVWFSYVFNFIVEFIQSRVKQSFNYKTSIISSIFLLSSH